MTDPANQADLSGSTTPVRLAGSRPRTDASGELALAAWDEFEGRLTRSLASMATDSYLILTLTPDAAGDAHRYVQFAQAGPTGLRAEAVGNGFLPGPDRLTPAQEAALLALGWQAPYPWAKKPQNWSREWPMPAPFEEVAALAVRTLREVYGTEAPEDLAYRRFTRDGEDFDDRLLGIAREAREVSETTDEPMLELTAPSVDPDVEAETPAGPQPTEVDRFRAFIEAALCEIQAVEAVAPDASGNYPVRVGMNTVLVRILGAEPPAVRVFADVLGPVPAAPELLVALNELNADLIFARALHVRGDVMVSLELPAHRLTPDALAIATAVIAGAAGRAHAMLTGRLQQPVEGARPN